jgi:hypothetical protein
MVFFNLPLRETVGFEGRRGEATLSLSKGVAEAG